MLKVHGNTVYITFKRYSLSGGILRTINRFIPHETHAWYTSIYHKFKPNVGEYTMHGSYGVGRNQSMVCASQDSNNSHQPVWFIGDLRCRVEISFLQRCDGDQKHRRRTTGFKLTQRVQFFQYKKGWFQNYRHRYLRLGGGFRCFLFFIFAPS